MPKNIIFSSITESFTLIWKNKLLFILLFILQIVFFVIFSYINLTHQTKILENTKTITDYLSQQKLDDISVTENILQQKSILGDDPLIISRNFNEIVKNFRLYLIYIFILFVFFISINWTLTNKLIHSMNIKKSIKIFLKNLIISSFYLGLVFVFLFSLINISITDLAETSKLFQKYAIFLVLSLILLYFMFVSIALLYKIEFKKIVQKTLVIGIKKIHYIIAAYFINIFLFTVSIFLFYYFIEKNLFILLLSILLLIFSFVFGRIFVINIVDRLEKS